MTERMTDEEFEALAEHHIGHPPGSKVFRLAEEARRAREAEEHHWKQVEMLQADLNAAMPMLAALEKESEARWHAAGCAGSPHGDGVEREMCDCAVGTVARARIATLTAQVERLEKLLHRYADNYQVDNECACDRCRLLADAQEALRDPKVDPFSLSDEGKP